MVGKLLVCARRTAPESVKLGSVPMLRYISHANVVIDPDVDVPRWGLSERGRTRTQAMLNQPWVPTVRRVITSGETKSREAGTILADALGLHVEIRTCSGETDRTSTGYVPFEEHERLAAAYFAAPTESADGWERSIDSQARIVACLEDLIGPAAAAEGVDVAVVGHGGVGTLWLCHLAGMSIDQRHDQPGQGHYYSVDIATGALIHSWRAIDDLVSAG